MSIKVLKKQGGFTLLELLIVIVIIGILALLIIPNVTSAPKKARDTQRKTDLRAIQKGLEEYYVSNSAYPTNATASSAATVLSGAADGKGTTGPLTTGTPAILKPVPVDPKASTTTPYTYVSADGTNYTLKACLENNGDNATGTAVDSTCGSATAKAFSLSSSN